MVAIVLCAVALAACSDVDNSRTTDDQESTTIETALLPVITNPKDLSEIVSAGAGGAIATVADGVLGIDLKGRLFYVAPDGDLLTIDSHIATNATAYYAFEEVAKAQADPVLADRFRVIDIAVRPRQQAIEIIVVHNYYDVDRRCVSLRVSVLTVADVLEVFTRLPTPSDWNLIFETEPCLALKFDDQRDRPVFDNGHVSGGRIVLDDDGSIVIGIGDFGNNGVDRPMALAQGDDTPYGKIIRLASNDGTYDVVSRGHRNPQGLILSSDGSLYETEHGPRGGDELNLISDGRNYGWPLVTLGTNYGSMTWPLNPHQGRHDSYEPPLFAWVPSIAVSSLIEIHGFAPEWSGDLLIATLKDNALWRTRVTGNRVLLTERIPVGSRIRDIVETENGEIVLWTDNAQLITLRPSAVGS